MKTAERWKDDFRDPDEMPDSTRCIVNAEDIKEIQKDAIAELLDALKQAYTVLEKSVHFETDLPFWRKGGDGFAAMLDTRAAIAKATGKEIAL